MDSVKLDSAEETVQEELEYILLDLDALDGQVNVCPGASYRLSALETLNPELTIGDKIKLVGEYEETIGTCLAFSESGDVPNLGSSEENISSGRVLEETNQTPEKHLIPIASLNKIVKFKLLIESEKVEFDAADNKL